LIRQVFVELIALLACFGAQAAFSAEPETPAGDWSRFVGEWAPASDATAAVEQAIEHATDSMGFLVAGIARSRLYARCRPPRELRMRASDEGFVIEFVGMETQFMPRSGLPVEQRGRRLSAHLEGGVLVHWGETSEGTRINRFSLDAGGRVLTMATVVTSPRLPEPVRFRVRFVRVAPR
jgi:hypothetical protein